MLPRPRAFRDAASTLQGVDTAGRWLPQGVHVERGEVGQVRLRGGQHDGRTFDSIRDLQDFVRSAYPDFGPELDEWSRGPS